MFEIIEDDIQESLQKKYPNKALSLVSFKGVPVSEKIGLLGDHANLNVTVKNEDTGEIFQDSFFIKYFPRQEGSAKFAEDIGAFKKEMFIYSLFEDFKVYTGSLLSSCVPTCYLSRSNNYLILNNLRVLDYEAIDKKKLLEYDEVLTVIQFLAKLHASSLIYEEKKSEELGKEYRLIEEYKNDLVESFFNDANREGIEASIKGVLTELDLFDFPQKLPSGKNFAVVARSTLEKIYEIVQPSKKYRNVITHGDLWVTNLLIHYKNGEPDGCKFVDFQSSRYVPPANDVLSFLYLTTSRQFRDRYMYQLLGIYYNYLDKYLKASDIKINDVITFQDFMDSCEDGKLFAIIQTAFHYPLILISTDCIEQYFVDKELYRKTLFEDRGHLVLAHKDKDEIYAKRLRDSILDLKNYCDYLF